jgi:hypothetical protein
MDQIAVKESFMTILYSSTDAIKSSDIIKVQSAQRTSHGSFLHGGMSIGACVDAMLLISCVLNSSSTTIARGEVGGGSPLGMVVH